MKIGEKIKEIRTNHNLSQEQFSVYFDVTRQTVSNWENGKSLPDLEMIVQICDYFDISVDSLLKDDPLLVKEIDNVKSKNKKFSVLLIVISVLLLIGSIIGFNYIKKENQISFEMVQDKTISIPNGETKDIEIGKGYFTLPRNGKVSIQVDGDIDSGDISVHILNRNNNKEVYQISGEQLKDKQKIYLEKASYKIQIKADNYKENIVSYDYQVLVKSQ